MGRRGTVRIDFLFYFNQRLTNINVLFSHVFSTIEYTEMVNNLQMSFETATKKYFEQNSDDEDIFAAYPASKASVFREKSHSANSVTPKIQEIISKKGLPAKLAHLIGDDSRRKYKVSESDDADGIETNKRAQKRKHRDKSKHKKKKSSRHSQSANSEIDNVDEIDAEVDDGPVSKKKAKHAKKEQPDSLKKTKKI